MVKRIGLTFFLAYAAGAAACMSEQSLESYTPPQEVPAPRGPSVFTTLELKPDSLSLEQGSEVQITFDARDQYGRPMYPSTVEYSSSAPSVATVNGSGYVLGIEPGTTALSATLTIGAYTLSGKVNARVKQSVVSDTVIFTGGISGWQPAFANVKTGGIVQWKGPPPFSGSLDESIWIMDVNYGVLDRAIWKDGIATYAFKTPGIYRFCSGSCWDPPEFGIIYSH